MNHHILIVHPEGNIKDNPNLYFFVKILTEQEYYVTIVSNVHINKYQKGLFEGAKFVLLNTKPSIKNILAKYHLFKKNFCHVIGIDDGIIDAKKYSNLYGVPLSYISYEIFFDDELESINSTYFSQIKKHSKEACQNIIFAIAQDETRKELLSKEYNIPLEKILLMPVAGRGKRQMVKNKYFHDALGIPYDKKVLLYMGTINDWQINNLISYSHHLPENWVLVAHSRYFYKGLDNIIHLEYPKHKIYFSLDSPIENIEDIGDILSGADAGLCPYQSGKGCPYSGKNLEYIGMASGKASTFLQYGVPIVIKNMTLWDDIVEKYKIGLSINQPKEIANIDFLSDETISLNCLNYFANNLDIDIYANKIISILNKNLKKSSKPIDRLQFLILGSKELIKVIKYNLIKFYRTLFSVF